MSKRAPAAQRSIIDQNIFDSNDNKSQISEKPWPPRSYFKPVRTENTLFLC